MLCSMTMLITSESLKASLCFPFPDRKEMFEIVHQFLDQLNEAIGLHPSSFEVIDITYGDSMLNRADAVVPWIEFIGDTQQRSRLLAMHRVLLPDVAVDVFPPERMQAFQALRTEFHCKPDQFFGQINIRLPHDSARQREFERGLAELYFWRPRTQTPTPVCIVKTGLNYCCHYLAENPDHHPCEYPDLPEGYDFARLENLREQLLADLAEYMIGISAVQVFHTDYSAATGLDPPWRKLISNFALDPVEKFGPFKRPEVKLEPLLVEETDAAK